MMTKSNPSQTTSPEVSPLETRSLDAIGRALRAHYDDLLSEPLPRRFEELLARLEAAEPDGGAPAAPKAG